MSLREELALAEKQAEKATTKANLLRQLIELESGGTASAVSGKRGRPKGSGKKATTAPADEAPTPTASTKKAPKKAVTGEAPKKRGRPPGVKNKPKDDEATAPKKRGRPPGVKNKPKDDEPESGKVTLGDVLLSIAAEAEGPLKNKQFVVAVAKAGYKSKGDLPNLVSQKLNQLVRDGKLTRNDETREYWSAA